MFLISVYSSPTLTRLSKQFVSNRGLSTPTWLIWYTVDSFPTLIRLSKQFVSNRGLATPTRLILYAVYSSPTLIRLSKQFVSNRGLAQPTPDDFGIRLFISNFNQVEQTVC